VIAGEHIREHYGSHPEMWENLTPEIQDALGDSILTDIERHEEEDTSCAVMRWCYGLGSDTSFSVG